MTKTPKTLKTKYGRWSVLSPSFIGVCGHRYVKVECDCGTLRKVLVWDLEHVKSKSCGCLARDVNTSHGMAKTRAYKIWKGILTRCRNPKDTSYKYYGGRGIKVCDAWIAFESFWGWAETDYKATLTLDREDTDKGYSPENCRWVEMRAQAQGRRKLSTCNSKTSSKYIGVTKKNKRWHSNATLKGARVHLGTYATEEEAAQARDEFVITHYDKCATLNFPLKGLNQ